MRGLRLPLRQKQPDDVETTLGPRASFALMVGFACTLGVMRFGLLLLSSAGFGCHLPSPTRFRLYLVQQAAERFIIAHERCPHNIGELAEANEIRAYAVKDTWREDIVLACILTDGGPTAVAFSAGPDRQFGTDDDLSSDLSGE